MGLLIYPHPQLQGLAEILNELPAALLHRINILDTTALMAEVSKDKEDKEQAENNAFTKIFVKTPTFNREEIINLVYFRPDVVGELSNWFFKQLLTTNHRQNTYISSAKTPTTFERVLVGVKDWAKDLKHKFLTKR